MPKRKPPSKKCSRENCNAWAMVGTLFCRKHTQYEFKRGVLAANLKRGGRYSASLPADLLGKYENSRRDPHLLELRDEIAVVISRSQQIQEKMETFESGKAWKEIKKRIAEYDEALTKKDFAAMGLAMAEVKKLTEEGCGEYAIWQEQEKLFQLHMKLVESERKRLLELKRYLELERIILIVESLAAAIHEEVEDAAIREAIGTKLEAIMKNSHISTVEARAEVLEEHYQQQIEASGLF